MLLLPGGPFRSQKSRCRFSYISTRSWEIRKNEGGKSPKNPPFKHCRENKATQYGSIRSVHALSLSKEQRRRRRRRPSSSSFNAYNQNHQNQSSKKPQYSMSKLLSRLLNRFLVLNRFQPQNQSLSKVPSSPIIATFTLFCPREGEIETQITLL